MRALLHLKWLFFKNSLKQLKEKPGKLIVVIFYGALFAFLFLVPNRTETLSGDDKGNKLLIFRLIFLGLLLLSTIPSWISGTKKGSSLFSASDVQFLFTAPFRPQTLLMYGMLNQLKALVLSGFFLLYQIPNLKNMGLNTQQIILAIGLFIGSAFINQCISMYLYCASYDSPARRKLIVTAIYALPLVLLVNFAYSFFRLGSMLPTLEHWLSSISVRFFPVAGWALQVIDGAIREVTLPFWFALGLLIATPLILLLLIYRKPVDFYEDALTVVDSGIDQSLQKAEMKAAAIQRMYGKRKVRGQGIRHGCGESAIFFKNWRERRRTRPYWIGIGMIVQFVVAVAMSLMFTRQSEPLQASLSALFILAASLGILYFSAFNSTLFGELADPSFYLLPGRPLKKTVYAALLGLILILIDLLPGYLVASVVLHLNPLYFLFGLLGAAGFYIALNAGQMITFRIMGEVDTAMASLVLMSFTLLVIAPGALLVILTGIHLLAGNAGLSILFYLGAFALNLMIGLLGLLLGKRHFN